MTRHKILIANLGSAHSIPGIKKRLQKHKPDLAILTEAYNCKRFFNNTFGYTFEQEANPLRDNSVAMLTTCGNHGKVNNYPTFINWKWNSGPRLPRNHQRYWSPEFRALGIHFPPTKHAYRNYYSRIHNLERTLKWLDHGHIPSIAAGDTNMDVDFLRKNLPNKYRVIRGSNVSHFIVSRDIQVVSVKRLRIPRAARKKGCHGWVLLTIEL